MLHRKKREGLLKWLEIAGSCDLQSFKELSDGSVFYQLIESLLEKKEESTNEKKSAQIKEDDKLLSETNLLDNFDCQAEGKKLSSKTTNNTIKIDNINETDVINVTCSREPKNNESDDVSQSHLNNKNDSDVITNDVVMIDVCIDSKNNFSPSRCGTQFNGLEILAETSTNVQSFKEDLVKEQSVPVPTNNILSENSFNENLNQSNNKIYHPINIINDSIIGNGSVDGTMTSVGVDSEKSNDEILQHYDVVKKFIENMLELNSENLVSFSDCIKSLEIELAKVATLLLSSMVQYALSAGKDHIMATCYSLDSDLQEEIMDCVELFLKERNSAVTKTELHNRLIRTARPRINPHSTITPPKDMATPQRNKLKQSKKSSRKKINKMEVFFKDSDSPIHNLIKSPYIRQITPNSEARLLEAMRGKDKTIALLTHDLDVEKFNADDLKKENEELLFKLSQSKKEKEKLKEDLTEAHNSLENQKLVIEQMTEEFGKEKKNYHKRIKDLESDLQFWKDSNQQESPVKNEPPPPKCSCSEEISSLQCSIEAKDDKIKELQKQFEVLSVHMEKLKWENEDLISKLDAASTSEVKSNKIPCEEKCFNISDLSIRNQLKEDCSKLTQEKLSLLEILSEKKKCEKELREQLRVTNKEREHAVKNLKKLEEEKLKLIGQIEAYEKILISQDSASLNESNVTSSASVTKDLDQHTFLRRSIRSKNVCDSEKLGRLWSHFGDESTPIRSDNSIINSDNNNSPTNLKSVINSKPIEMHDTKLVQWEKSVAKELNENSANKSSSASNGKLSCTENEFSMIKSLVKDLIKILKQKNIIESEILSNLQNLENHFECVKDLINALKLFYQILVLNKLKGSSVEQKKSSLHCDFQEHVNYQQLLDENIKLKSDISELEEHQKNSHKLSEQIVALKEKLNIYEICNDLDVLPVSNIVSTIIKKSKEKEVPDGNPEEINLKTKVKDLEDEIEALQIQLTKSNDACDTNLIQYTKTLAENEKLVKKIKMLEKNEKVARPVPAVPANKICEKCALLIEKMKAYKSEKIGLEKNIFYLNQNWKHEHSKNQCLTEELKKLESEKFKLKDQLAEAKIWRSAAHNPSILKMGEELRIKAAVEKELLKLSNEKLEDENSNSMQDFSNLSAIPHAEKSKNQVRSRNKLNAFCKAEDEDDMLSQSSIAEIFNESPTDRVKEFRRRNTLCLPHLKSVYAVELNTTPSQEKYFKAPTPVNQKHYVSRKMSRDDSTMDNHITKKRKVSNSEETSFSVSAASFLYPKSDRNVLPKNRIAQIRLPSSTPKENVQKKVHGMYRTPSSLLRVQSMGKSDKSKRK